MGWLIVFAYLYAILPGINSTFTALTIASACAAAASAFIGLMLAGPISEGKIFDVETHENWKGERQIFDRCMLWAKRLGIAWAVILCTSMVIPDREGFKYIVGAVIVAETAEGISTIEGIEKLPANVVDALNVMLEDITGEIIERGKENVGTSESTVPENEQRPG